MTDSQARDLEVAHPSRAVLRAGTATSVGSLPHLDPDDAVAFVLDHHRDLPAAPQLPGTGPAATMVPQWSRGIAGVGVRADGSLTVDRALIDPEAPVAVDLAHPAHAGLLPFLDAVAARRQPIKLQLTGPITLGLALEEAGLEQPLAFAVAAAATRANLAAVSAAASSRAPSAPRVVFLDEPGLVACAHPGFPLDRERVVDLLSGALASAGDVVTGVHCCGATDWRLVTAAGPDIISLPVMPGLVDAAGAVDTFLDAGGWIAWGAVPTVGPLGTTGARLWDRMSRVWCELVRRGVDPALLRCRALITPSCGLAGHGVSQAGRALDLAVALGSRVGEQAAAARFAMGA